MTQLATRHPDRDSESIGQKSTLYCFDCDHANPIDGDWTRHITDDATVYSCPDCGATIAERPRSTDDSDDPDRVPPDTPLARVIRRSADVWQASIDVGLRSSRVLTHRNR